MNKEEQIQYIKDNYPLYIRDPRAKRALRHNFFSKIETELQAYLLGFYAADGNINEKRKTLRIHLQKQDHEVVDYYKIISPDAYTFTKKSHYTTGRNHMTIQAHESYGIDINSTIICQDLVKLGFGYAKSYKKLHLPNIPENLIPAFIRGFWEGDGSFVQTVNIPRNKKNFTLRSYFFLQSKYIDILQDILLVLSKRDINVHIVYIRRDNMYRLGVCSKPICRKIYHYLYDNANFYMKRKYEKFKYFANTEDLQLIAEACNA